MFFVLADAFRLGVELNSHVDGGGGESETKERIVSL
jgi:hypothetical protein